MITQVKVKVTPRQAYVGTEGRRRCSSNPFLTSGLEGGGWSATRPVHFTPGKDPALIVQEIRWTSEQVWTGTGNLAPTGDRSPDRSALS